MEQADPKTGSGTGFKFVEPTTEALLGALRQALGMWRENPRAIQKMRRTAMKKDFGWERSVKQYEKLYADAMKAAKG